MMVSSQSAPRTAVLILLMEHEIEVTLTTLEGLLPSLSDHVEAFVLLNGARRPDLAARLSQVLHIRYHESQENLGVAGGRNFLLALPEVSSADIILLLDNDVLVPNDYVERLVSVLLENDRHGVVGATVLSYPYFKQLSDGICSFESRPGTLVPYVPHFTCDQASQLLRRSKPTPPMFNHVGTNPDWHRAYLSVYPWFQRLLLVFGNKPSDHFRVMLTSDPLVLAHFRSKKPARIEVSNVIGCSQAFRRSLIDEIGNLNELFSPYGYEDVDFCIRALKNGYRNVVATDCLLFHGTDSRHDARNASTSRIGSMVNQLRALTILTAMHRPDDWRGTIAGIVQVRLLTNLANRSPDTLLTFYSDLKGFFQGSRQLEQWKARG